MSKTYISKNIKEEILNKVKDFYQAIKDERDNSFFPGKSKVNYAGRIYDENELLNLVDSSLEFWLTYGKYSKIFEEKLSEFLGLKYSFLVNSGSSANLLAFMALTSPLLGKRKIERGDEVITVAAGFPTTVAPIIQYGAIPVFIDINLDTYNIDISQLETALSDKTKAVMLAHTLGNPFNLKKIKKFCDNHNLWLIEDNCDSLGTEYFINDNWEKTGSIGDIGTSSFYPPHHITTGEGGAVYTNNPLLKKIILSIRDWGRDCWCESGVDNTCGCRFSKKFGDLPYGYDHKYVYSHFGFNFKATEMQAAIGCAQIEKLPYFIKSRIENFNFLYNELKCLENIFILPQKAENSKPSWFGFLLTLKSTVKFERNEITEFLELNKIQTRNLFAGNIIKHPCFENLVPNKNYKIIGNLKNTDKVMNDSFWVGVYPGMNKTKLKYIVDKIKEFIFKNNL